MKILDPLTSFAVSTCSHPVLINRGSSVVPFPCGQCPSCRRKYHFSLSNQIIYNSSIADNVSFYATFSFSPKKLPLIRFEVDFEDSTFRYHYYNYSLKRVDYFNIPLDHSILKHLQFYFKNVSSDIFYKCSKKSKFQLYQFDGKSYKIFPIGYIAYCSSFLFSLFLKTLRKKVSHSFQLHFKHVFTCEYGGQHFRPHYHALFHFKKCSITTQKEFAVIFRSFLDKYWKFGSVYWSGLVSSEHPAKYISEYLCDNSSLPSFLRSSFLRQKTIHSVYYCPNVDLRILSLFLQHPKTFAAELSSLCSDPLASRSYPSLFLSFHFRKSIAKFSKFPQFTHAFLSKIEDGTFSTLDNFLSYVSLHPSSYISSNLHFFNVNVDKFSPYVNYVPFISSLWSIYNATPDHLLLNLHISPEFRQELCRLVRIYSSLSYLYKLYVISSFPSLYNFLTVFFDSCSNYKYSVLLSQYHRIKELESNPLFDISSYFYSSPLSPVLSSRRTEVIQMGVKHKESSNLTFFSNES